MPVKLLKNSLLHFCSRLFLFRFKSVTLRYSNSWLEVGPRVSFCFCFVVLPGMRRLVCIVGCLVCVLCGRAQGRGQDVVQRVLDMAVLELGEDGAGEEVLVEIAGRFEQLLQRPLYINGAGREQLEELCVLSDFQIESILEYRRVSGNILSAAELALLHGFSTRIVGVLVPFIAFGEGEGERAGREKSELLLKLKWKGGEDNEKYLGPQLYNQLKYKWEVPQKWQAGFQLERDIGEQVCSKGQLPMADFASFHLMARNLKLRKGWKVANVVAGDYSIRLGQGLTAWNSFSLQGNASVQGVMKRGAPVAPYTASDENRFFRGTAVTVQKKYAGFRELEFTAFWSLKNVDARIKDGKYTSLPTDGLHNTESLLETRKTLGELAYGARCGYRNRRLKVGLNCIGYGYNAHNGRRVQDYNRYLMYDGQYGNFSVDAMAVAGRTRLFAEAAMDYGGAAAFLAGAVSRLGEWEGSLICRSYSRSYIAPYAGAYSSSGSCSNQSGVAFTVQNSYGKVRLQGGGGYTYYPWKRYNVGESSGEYSLWLRMDSVEEDFEWNMKVYHKGASYGTKNKCGVKGLYGKSLGNWLYFKMRGEFVALEFQDMGMALGSDLIFNILADKLRLVMRGVWYSCREWESRIYMYEYDLPSSYASTLMYGKGWKWYALLNAKIGRLCSIHIKGSSDSQVKLGLKMRFF